MKRLLLLAIAVVTSLILAYGPGAIEAFQPRDSQIEFGDCEGKRCTFDTDCGFGCECYKQGNDLYGVCVRN